MLFLYGHALCLSLGSQSKETIGPPAGGKAVMGYSACAQGADLLKGHKCQRARDQQL